MQRVWRLTEIFNWKTLSVPDTHFLKSDLALDRWKPCSCGDYRRWRIYYRGGEVRRVISMSRLTIAIFLTICEMHRSKMLFELSVIILESCYTYLISSSHTLRNLMGERWQRCYLPIPESEYFLAKCHMGIKIQSNDECFLIVAYSFRPLYLNHFTGLVAESLKVLGKTQHFLCNHYELLPVGKGSCSCDVVSRDEVGIDRSSWC